MAGIGTATTDAVLIVALLAGRTPTVISQHV
jgi:hypothetical protein